MKVRIKILLDTSKWHPEHDFWIFAPGLKLTCDESELMPNLEAIYKLGHEAEVTYLEE